MLPRILSFTICFVGLAATAAELDKTKELNGSLPAGMTMALENDVLSLTKKSDRWYTNGLHVAWHLKPGEEPILSKETQALGRWLFRLGDCPSMTATTGRCGVTTTSGFGQNMYTPREIDNPNPQLTDRWTASIRMAGKATFILAGWLGMNVAG